MSLAITVLIIAMFAFVQIGKCERERDYRRGRGIYGSRVVVWVGNNNTF